MKYAAAMALAGELVSAEDSNHETFKRLVPLCPECGSPVYFRKEQDRISPKGKPYVIPAHWCHFQADQEKAVECEKRVAKYTSEERNKIKSKARNQRLKWLQRGFWGIFKKYYSNTHQISTLFKNDEHLLDSYDQLLKSNVNDWYKVSGLFEVYKDRLLIDSFDMVDVLIEEHKNNLNNDDQSIFWKIRHLNNENYAYALFIEAQKVFIEHNRSICSINFINKNYIQEILKFLSNKSSQSILIRLFLICFCNHILLIKQGERYNIINIEDPIFKSVPKPLIMHEVSPLSVKWYRSIIVGGTLMLIMMIPWDYEFSYLKEHGKFSKIIPEGYDYSMD